MKKRLWLWITLFVFASAVIGTLATSWNVVMVIHAHRMVELAQSMKIPSPPRELTSIPWVNLILGTLGFAAALVVTILFFVRLLREMNLTQMQTDFLAKVSHELKTPIATLELTGSLLRRASLPEAKRAGLWEAFDADLKRLRGEVETLLDASHWQTSLRRPALEPVNLEAWIERSVPEWQARLGEGAKLTREGRFEPSARVRLDLGMLRLVTDNLVDNARKYAQGSPQLVLRAQELPPRGGPPRWRLVFEDRGWGFEPKHARRLFRRFHREPNPAPYAIPGTGLGLFLAREASRAQGLRLIAESDGPGRGARFILEGPYYEQQPMLNAEPPGTVGHA
ncbi:MAG TPA: HAMP domain-containing sensor histidine kinase [Bdellovibrionota bacterium]|jgi:signal transduction histidine kinase|nr:HAMP domain-containing sensor histidine kinase [Bdellovibrionota bacterium]